MSDESKLDDQLIENIDPKESVEYIKNFLEAKQKELAELPEDADENKKALIQLDIAEAMVGLGKFHVDRGNTDLHQPLVQFPDSMCRNDNVIFSLEQQRGWAACVHMGDG